MAYPEAYPIEYIRGIDRHLPPVLANIVHKYIWATISKIQSNGNTVVYTNVFGNT